MDAHYLGGMPASILTKICQVEDLIGSPISVRETAHGEYSASPDVPALADYGMTNGTADATIVLLRNNVAAHVIAHEVLHIHRAFVEAVPCLVPLRQGISRTFNWPITLENEIEHIFIVPEETSLFPESQKYWEDHYVGLLNQSPDWRDLVRHALFLRLALPASPLNAQITKNLADSEVSKMAEKLIYQIKRAQPNKQEMLRVLITFLKLGTDNFALRQYRVADKVITCSPL